MREGRLDVAGPGTDSPRARLAAVDGSKAGRKGASDGTDRLVALGRALSDPIRVEMLGIIAWGRDCCEMPECGVPAEDRESGICVCEFQGYFGMGQSKVSYHVKKLKEAGLVREERRGRWGYYSLEREAAEGLLSEAARWLLVPGGSEAPRRRRAEGRPS